MCNVSGNVIGGMLPPILGENCGDLQSAQDAVSSASGQVPSGAVCSVYATLAMTLVLGELVERPFVSNHVDVRVASISKYRQALPHMLCRYFRVCSMMLVLAYRTRQRPHRRSCV